MLATSVKTLYTFAELLITCLSENDLCIRTVVTAF